jgi:DUF1680 family protein
MRKILFTLLTLVAMHCHAAKERLIKTVEPINIESPVGTVPRLPYQVYVTYSDGTKEWRQVKWENSLLSTEQQEANATLYPVGKEYTINGYIIGDNTTDNGYPLKANIKVVSGAYNTPTNKFKACPLPLSNVKITGDNRLTNNRDLDIRTILSWDITQQLYNYRDTYGLPTEGYTVADGWDSPTTKLKGHGSGHYMSALAFAYASAKDESQKAELHKRIERMVNELRMCQERTFVWDSTLNRYWEARDYAPEEELKHMKGTWTAFNEYKKDYKHYGYGYLNAIPAAHPALIEYYRAYNNEDWVWAPYYTIHKQLAGLIDIANVMNQSSANKNNGSDSAIAAKALLIAKDMGLWVWNRMHYRTYIKKDGNKAERQARPGNRYEMWNMYIAGEVGGMAESLSRLSEMVSNPTEKARLLEAANCFDAPAFFDPVATNIDDIRTRHANQHIPMITGALRSYLGNGNPYYYNLAQNFWTLIQGRYAYAMGSVGNGEMWRQPYSQILSMNTNVQSDHNGNIYPNPDINETCCAYNLAKLTKDLNCFDPDNAAYMDYYERVLYNQIVGSVHPEHWAVTYQYAVGMNARKPYGNETPQSTCCGGTGAENHVKYQEAAYFANENTIWVALYIPSIARWNGAKIIQDCQWPADRSTITVQSDGKPARFAMKLRVPYWATKGFDIRLNGKSIAKTYRPSSYVEIAERQWNSSDKIEIIMPFTVHIFWGPDKMDVAATGKNESRTAFPPMWVGTIMYGPLAMATTDIHHWKDADINLSSTLEEIQTQNPTGTDGTGGALYSLSIPSHNIQFTPDYFQTDNATHYLRLNVKAQKKQTRNGKIDKTNLEHAIQIAKERVKSQQEWNTLTVKVPNFSPWAPYGYQRLVQQLNIADSLSNAIPAGSKDKQGKLQEEINNTTSALNVAINSMRPGNLAEPEDLAELLALETSLKENIPNKSNELRATLRYADMVVRYVNDGSGTHDLIEKAITRLKEFQNK